MVYWPWLLLLVVLDGTSPTAPDLRSLHTLFDFPGYTAEGGGGRHIGIMLLWVLQAAPSSTLPSPGLSMQGLLFNSCGSVGNRGQKTVKGLVKTWSLTMM